jgi:Fe-S oxidoreductase
MNRILNIAPGRSLPPFAPSLYKSFRRHRRRAKRAMTARPKVLLYADCFTTYNEPHIGQAAVRVLESLGYEVLLPPITCCGRAMVSTGLLEEAMKSANRAMATLVAHADEVAAIVVCEPSCLSAITDDWLELKLAAPLADRKRIADKTMLVEDFVDRCWDQHPTRPTLRANASPIVLHGHCHQKAVGGGEETSARLLRRLSSGSFTVIASGCCGMAGSFGYAADKYDLSMKIGELSLFPPVRSAPANATICAPGTSCRHQIEDGTGRRAVHPVELIASLLCTDDDVVI